MLVMRYRSFRPLIKPGILYSSTQINQIISSTINWFYPECAVEVIILADNVLFHGQVLEEPVKGKNAKAIQSFNEYVQQDESVDKVMLTIRDGLLMIRKK